MVHRQVLSAFPVILTTGFSAAFEAGILFCIIAAGISLAIRNEREMA